MEKKQLKIREQIGYLDPVIVYEKVLGKGTYGTVYECEFKEEKCAAKYLLKKQFKNEKEQQVLQREFDLLNKLKHQNIIEMKYLHEDNDRHIMVLEFCDCALSKFIKEQSRLLEQEEITINNHIDTCLQYFQQIVAGLNYLYEQKVEHRDLKPDNILIKNNIIKIADFGFAKQIQNQNLHEHQTSLGTRLYSSPQQFNQEFKEYSIKCDIWSLGVIFYEMIFLELPFKHGGSIINTQKKPFKFNENDYTTEVLKNEYPKIKKLIVRMLQFEERDRISMEDLIEYNLYEKTNSVQQSFNQDQQQNDIQDIPIDSQQQSFGFNNQLYKGKQQFEEQQQYHQQQQQQVNLQQQYQGEQIIGNTPNLFNFLNNIDQNLRQQNEEIKQSNSNQSENDIDNKTYKQWLQSQQVNNIDSIQILAAEEKKSIPKDITYYKIESKIDGQTFIVNRRFSEFKDFIQYFHKKAEVLNVDCLVIPQIEDGDLYYNQFAVNVKSLIQTVKSETPQKYTDSEFIQNRLKSLDYFLQQCLKLTFIKNDSYFKNFISCQDLHIIIKQKNDSDLQNQQEEEKQQQDKYNYQKEESSLVNDMSKMWNSFKIKTKAAVTTLVNDNQESELHNQNYEKIKKLKQIQQDLKNQLKSKIVLNEQLKLGIQFIINVIKAVQLRFEYFQKQKKDLKFSENVCEEKKNSIQSQQDQKEYEILQASNTFNRNKQQQNELTFNKLLDSALDDCKQNLSEILKLQSQMVSSQRN